MRRFRFVVPVLALAALLVVPAQGVTASSKATVSSPTPYATASDAGPWDLLWLDWPSSKQPIVSALNECRAPTASQTGRVKMTVDRVYPDRLGSCSAGSRYTVTNVTTSPVQMTVRTTFDVPDYYVARVRRSQDGSGWYGTYTGERLLSCVYAVDGTPENWYWTPSSSSCTQRDASRQSIDDNVYVAAGGPVRWEQTVTRTLKPKQTVYVWAVITAEADMLYDEIDVKFSAPTTTFTFT